MPKVVVELDLRHFHDTRPEFLAVCGVLVHSKAVVDHGLRGVEDLRGPHCAESFKEHARGAVERAWHGRHAAGLTGLGEVSCRAFVSKFRYFGFQQAKRLIFFHTKNNKPRTKQLLHCTMFVKSNAIPHTHDRPHLLLPDKPRHTLLHNPAPCCSFASFHLSRSS